MPKKIPLKYFLILQLMLMVFSLALALVKAAAEAWNRGGFWSWPVITALGGSVLLLALYAFGWQQILKRLPLTVAYFNKGLVVFWGLAWAVLLFGETLTFFNILGTAVIFAGLVLVNRP